MSITSAALATAHLTATLAMMDSGSTGSTGGAKLKLYSSLAQPAPGDAAMCTIHLARPSAVVSGASLILSAPEPGLVMTAGMPRWGVLEGADGTALHTGDVSDAEHDGFYKVSGAQTPPGETTPMFQAGATVTLGAVVYT